MTTAMQQASSFLLSVVQLSKRCTVVHQQQRYLRAICTLQIGQRIHKKFHIASLGIKPGKTLASEYAVVYEL